jgi:uncharacterized LabA/DUF88 family protein
MSRLAIFIDGHYLESLAKDEYGVSIDHSLISEEIRLIVNNKTPDSIDLLRTFYYDCLPYQSNPPTEDEKSRFGKKRGFFNFLNRLSRFVVREGRLAFKGMDIDNNPIFQQKRVDLLLGLDFALLSGKRQITHAAVIAGDSDLLPAFKVAKEEGILVWLFHGPQISRKDGFPTFASELWQEADERYEIDLAFMRKIQRSKT